MKGVFWFLLVTVACAVALYWFGFSDKPPRPDAARQSPVVAGQSADMKEEVPDPEPAPAAPKPPAPPLIVDSFSPSERVLLENWPQIPDPSGHFDEIRRLRDGAHVEEGLLIEPTDFLIARGWAGNFPLGLQFKDIVLSACGQIVARGQVGALRPDVANAIHPNLASSGWAARVLGGDLPFCADSQLRGWVIVPGGTAVLAPLVGSFSYVSPAPADVPNRLSAQQSVTPQTYPKPRFVSVNVTATKANLRKCGSTSCEVVGQVARGEYVAHIATRDAEWSLVLFAGGAGWLFNDLFETAR